MKYEKSLVFKFFILNTLLILLINNQTCQNLEKRNNQKNIDQIEVIKESQRSASIQKYDFDKVAYYKLNETIDFIPKNQESEEGQYILGVMYGEEPFNIEDGRFTKVLETIGFIKKEIRNKDKIDMLSNSITIGLKPTPYVVTSCLSTYRDILILKKEDKITGIAKLCFSCGTNKLLGGNETRDDMIDIIELGTVSKILATEIEKGDQ